MTVRAKVSGAINASLSELGRAHGFKKKGAVFHRRLGGTTQLIAFQFSKANLGDEGGFFVNIGLVFDALNAVGGTTTGRALVGGEVVHWGRRPGDLLPNAPSYWDVHVTTDPEQLGASLRAALEPIVAMLDRLDGPAALLEAFSLDRGFEKVLRAELRYVLGRHAEALADLRAVAAEFSNRRGVSVERLIEAHRLDDLILLL